MSHKKNEIWDELYALASSGYAAEIPMDKLQQVLLEKHNDEALVYAVIKKVKSDHYAKRHKEGLTIIAIGGGFILTGFIITCFNFHANQSFSFAMYGLTTIGIGVIFWGLYKIIG